MPGVNGLVVNILYTSPQVVPQTFLLMAAVKELYRIPNGSKVLVPACTWVTNVSPVFQVGLEPVFCDVDLERYSFDLDTLPEEDIRIVFITHLLGINSTR